MDRHFDSDLEHLKDRLLAMGGLVEKAIDIAITGLLDESPNKIARVYEIEKQVNQAHIEIDEICVRLIALHQPLAKDLRFIVASIKINGDLERMGDHAVNIANNAERYLQGQQLIDLPQLRTSCTEVGIMVKGALDAFVSGNIEQARNIMMRDDIVDRLKNESFHAIMDVMRKEPKLIDQGLNVILITRNLEKIGDHATNIAEDVIYFVSGEDIRHRKPHAARASG